MILNLKRGLFFFTLFFILGNGLFVADVHADTGYTTDLYDVKVDVKEDHSIMVTETIKVNFKTARHGIYRTIPIRGKAYFKVNGKATSLSSAMKIDQVKVSGFEYETGVEGKNYVIRIGSPDHTVEGKQTYRISYRCRVYDDHISDYDIFYYNVLPHGWETQIKEADITVNLPKTPDDKKLDVYVGTYGKNQYANRVDTNIDGSKISMKSNQLLPEGAGITVQKMLPDDYFKGEMSTDWAYYSALAVGILTALLLFLMWLFLGRDKKIVKTVEFYPPEEITPAELGYVIDGKVHKKDIIAMLIYFADKGYIRIEEHSDEGIILKKVKSPPADAPAFERTVMDGVFRYGTFETHLKDMPKKFYESYEAAAAQIKSTYTDNKEKRLFHRSGNIARVLGSLLMLVPIGAGIVFGSIYEKIEFGFFAALPVCSILFLTYFCGMILYDRKGGMGTRKYLILNLLLLIAAILVTAIGDYIVFRYLGLLAALVLLFCTIVSYICTRQMRKLTTYGNQLIGKILGFKEFLILAEVDKLNELVEENPSYFYNVLPYVYVFDLSDKWARKFESIEVKPPEWYSGSYSDQMFNSWIFINAFHGCTRSMQDQIKITSPVETSSSSGSSFDSFGSGGGFSGGGFGGGGGGAW